MGIRYLLIIIGIWVLSIVIRKALRQRNRRPPDPTHQRQPVDMVRCNHCGTHLPAPEARQKDGKFYCSREHLLADSKENSTDT